MQLRGVTSLDLTRLEDDKNNLKIATAS